jgi:DNA polymerase III delta prime subunit
MWRILKTLAKRLLWSQRNRIMRLTDDELRAIARIAVGDGKRPFSVILAEARERVELTGARLDDAMDERLVNALDAQLALVRMPEQFEQLETAVKKIADAFDEKPDEKKGR